MSSSSTRISLGPNPDEWYFKETKLNCPQIAGYLGFEDTRSFGEWISSPSFQSIWSDYVAYRETNFGGVAGNCQVQLKHAMDTLREASTRVTLSAAGEINWPAIDDKARPTLYTLDTARRIVEGNYSVFNKFSGDSFTAENISRAIRVIRYMWDKKAKKESAIPSKNTTAVPPTVQSSNVSLWAGGDQAITDEQKSREPTPIPSSASGFRPLAAKELDLTFEIAETFDVKLDQVKEPTLHQKASRLIAIHPDNKVRLLKRIGNKALVVVEEQAVSESSDHSRRLDRILQSGANAHAASELDVEDGDSPEDGGGPEDADGIDLEAFWSLQNAVGDISAPSPSYTDASKIFDQGPEGPTINGLLLKPWQVIGVAWMLEQELQPLRGGIVADGCGLGKTLQTLAFLHCTLVRDRRAMKLQPHRPTLVLVPTGVIDTWVTEWARFFKNSLDLRVYHSIKRSRGTTKNISITSNELEDLWMEGGKAHYRNFEAREVVVLTSYETWTRRCESGWAGRFARVICDEGHKLKNRKSATFAAISDLATRNKWILSATPLINRVSDMIAYLTWFWRKDWKIPIPMGDSGEPSACYEHFWRTPPSQRQQFVSLALLDPDRFRANCSSGNMSLARAKWVLPAILGVIQLRRSTATRIVLGPDMPPQRIGSTIPPYRVRTVELRLSPAEQYEYNTFHNELIECLRRRNPNYNKLDADHEPPVFFDNHFLRRLSHLSFATTLERLVRKVNENGVNDVNRWREMTDGGARWFVGQTKLDYGLPVPTDCQSIAEYLAAGSPKLAYLSLVLMEVVLEKKEKLIIFCEWPMVAWLVEMYLRMFGIPYLAIRSSTELNDRLVVMAQFNDLKDENLILVTTFRTCSLGINLQESCCNMVILEPAKNINTLLQAIGRIHRVGQTREQNIVVLFANGTFNRWQEFQQSKKMIAQIAGSLGSTEEDGTLDGVDKVLRQLLGQTGTRLRMGDCRDLGAYAKGFGTG
jgi:SNF2 family DNA or RNA helicase